MKEEEYAWANGRKVLKNVMKEVGYDPAHDELRDYDASATHGVHKYRYRLGLEDLWPDE